MRATELTGAERDEKYRTQSERFPGFARYQQKTTRTPRYPTYTSEPPGNAPTCEGHRDRIVNTDDLLLHVDPLERLLQRRSAKWQTYPRDVLPLTVAEMDFALAPAVSAALRDAVERSDAGYAMAVPSLGQAVAAFAARRWSWDIDPASVTAVTDVGVGVVELLRAVTRPGDAVVISPPVYPPFFDWVPEAGARILEVPLAERACSAWTWTALSARSPPIPPPTFYAIRRTRSGPCIPRKSSRRSSGWRGSTGLS